MIAKIQCAYGTNYLRQEITLRDHGIAESGMVPVGKPLFQSKPIVSVAGAIVSTQA